MEGVAPVQEEPVPPADAAVDAAVAVVAENALAVARATLERSRDKFASSAAQGRHGRAAEVAEEAAVQAFAVHGDDSLVGASMRLGHASEAYNEATRVVDGEEKAALFASSWAALASASAVARRRLAAGTLLPGSTRPEEVAHAATLQASLCRALGGPGAPPAPPDPDAAFVGYNALLDCARLSLRLLRLRPWPAAERAAAELTVFVALDAVQLLPPSLALQPGAEQTLVFFFAQHMSAAGGSMDPAFHAAVAAKWASPGVVRALRARGSPQAAVAAAQAAAAAVEARRRADAAARGFRRCGLPSCGKAEVSVRRYRLCGGCDAVAYCCDDHHARHWQAGHRRECGPLRQAGGRPPSTADR